MPKTYFVYFTWSNTKHNHAGMSYFARQLKNAHPGAVRLVKIPERINGWPYYLKRLYFHGLVLFFQYVTRPHDKIFFMEYLGVASGNQTGLAMVLRRRGFRAKMFGLVHLSEKHLNELYEQETDIINGLQAVDKVIVFGSSLAAYFGKLGFSEKTICTFHYADTGFYTPLDHTPGKTLQIIHMGGLKRNFKDLRRITGECPHVHFHICQGNSRIEPMFSDHKNVTLHGFMSEADLRALMQQCEVSLSVLEDTVGSNVITTSMAVGLVNVVSDVGSIRDYCDATNSFLCAGNEQFVEAINTLSGDHALLQRLRANTLKRSADFSLTRSLDFFYQNFVQAS